jgi:hypothetical protein
MVHVVPRHAAESDSHGGGSTRNTHNTLGNAMCLISRVCTVTRWCCQVVLLPLLLPVLLPVLLPLLLPLLLLCRHRGIQRVALLDFDVHHGNGTRACVSNTAPSKLQVPFSTPMSEGVHIYNTYQPWFDTDDDDNILFASVQGYGPKSSTRPGGQSSLSCTCPAHNVLCLPCVHEDAALCKEACGALHVCGCHSSHMRAQAVTVFVPGSAAVHSAQQADTLYVLMCCCADIYVYPGSGATTDTLLLKAQCTAQQAALKTDTAADAGGAPEQAAAQPEAAAAPAAVMNGVAAAAGVKAEDGPVGDEAPKGSSLVSLPGASSYMR